ncbi:MAG: selenide, water dikinase SelD [Sphaerochaetaceae bacterium]|nr:selenide, water dikinase SelD [Sphaerochaetaceae bacterium]
MKLTSMVKTSGCAAKLAPAVLHSVLSSLPSFEPKKELLVGFESSDDALVWDLGNDSVLIETVDFFPPMVDDPFTFGQVAAANALSDVYAMGGTPAVAMNLLCIPSCLDSSVMKEILEGGYSKVKEAGAIIAGGHTISDPTPKYGLCVTGFGQKNNIWKNTGAKVGDVLVLTKPLGAGIINTAVKGEIASEESAKEVVKWMTTLNKYAQERAKDFEVHAATDVTGFSLLGHSLEMAQGSKVRLEIFSSSVPQMTNALLYASMGILPEGMYNNLDYAKNNVQFANTVPQELKDLLFDPQTSGGLLLSMNEKDAKSYVSQVEGAVIVGQVLPFNSNEKDIMVL